MKFVTPTYRLEVVRHRSYVANTDIYIRIDRYLDPARLPSLMDIFQQLLRICALTSDSQWAENVSPGVSLLVIGNNIDCRGT